ncbi:TetR/AcrR family transcriptional regulator [Rhizobium leguminosarum bv. trifolii]|uniref:TetR/AcrR family transcriptional regulator n=1 Tax=Rhizobium ruizarguesonis TaxID=2081791 RepID=UPI000519C45B|nr:TetR/AcrR family transcriptional regulator [Rhizobium ruizarguesonis]QIO42965.1 TetR/AcrR family transcriptional regulator [Rhizobium leguminosarum bv. trifolii]WSH19156.1 TetR/AcrR family transcriptional regulator [Rhizobium ruizarguesonis]WSH31903.1 TetR/AcrR family transcriptional regulator [Rhizobium ruizarguesonis]
MARQSRSRRERPSKPALSREGVIAAALSLFHEEGLAKVTMRRVAAVLDTGPASLYVYISDTEDLHAEILDALLARVAEPSSPADWGSRLKGTLRSYMAVLFEHPELARMAMSTMPSGANYLALVEKILALLKEGEVPDGQAAWAVDLLLLFATAQAAEKAAWKASARSPSNFSSLAAIIKTADAETLPNIVRHGADLLSGRGDRLDWGFDVLINGVLKTRRMETKS